MQLRLVEIELLTGQRFEHRVVRIRSSAANVSGSAWFSAGIALAFVVPMMARWPVTRRRCVWIAAAWLAVGSVLALPAWWATGTIVPLAACLAAILRSSELASGGVPPALCRSLTYPTAPPRRA